MRKYISTIALLPLLLSCSHGPKETKMTGKNDGVAATSASKGKTTCTNQNDVRSLEVKARNDGNSDLFYTKFGSEKAVASGGTQYCQKVSEQIKDHLTKSGFSCE